MRAGVPSHLRKGTVDKENDFKIVSLFNISVAKEDIRLVEPAVVLPGSVQGAGDWDKILH